MKNKELKIYVCETGQFDTYCFMRRIFHWQRDYYSMNDCDCYCLSQEEFTACEQLSNSKRKQRWRIRKRFESWESKNKTIYFVTFTFNDKALLKKPKTRRKYITNLLNKNTLDYVGMIDFSEEEREHYHFAFILDDSSKLMRNDKYKLYSDWLDRYEKNNGYYYVQQTRDTKKDHNKVKNYIAKKKVLSILYKNTNLICKRCLKGNHID